jgi:Fe-S cluster assembly protein SufD
LASPALALPELPSFKGKPGWEFTDLSRVDVDAYEPADAGDPSVSAERVFDREPTHTVVDAGNTEVDHPLLGTVVSADDPFVARNDAGRTGAAVVHVSRGERLDSPILLSAIQNQSGRAMNQRTLIVLEEGAEAEVWEEQLSSGPEVEGLVNTVVEIVVGPNARLRYVYAQDLSPKSVLFGTHRGVVEKHGSLEWVTLGFGSARGKVRMETELRGEGSEAKVTGAYAARGRQHLDFDTTQEHAAAHTTSDLAFRGVLADRSTTVWRGMIKVDPGAQQTDAFQDNRNLLLSKRAHADAIPGLEILANDVRCTHAAAVAQIDRDQLFYLMSRGLTRDTATRLIIDGFLQSLVERLGEGDLHDAVSAALERRLSAILDR